MHRISLLLGGILLLTIIDFDSATKHHRDRGHHRQEQESLLDKQERERENKDRKKDEEEKTLQVHRNVTCYKCDGDLCRDPFQPGLGIPTIQCEHNCWKGVFAASVRRACGNARCSFYFKGGSALSTTCCKTSLCNHTSMKIPSMMILLLMILLTI